MIRFVDIRGNDTGHCFAWWDTVRDRFQSFNGYQAFTTWQDFLDSFDKDDLDRYKRLCPLWVFSSNIQEYT